MVADKRRHRRRWRLTGVPIGPLLSRYSQDWDSRRRVEHGNIMAVAHDLGRNDADCEQLDELFEVESERRVPEDLQKQLGSVRQSRFQEQTPEIVTVGAPDP